MIISRRKLDQLMQEHTAKALEEAHRRNAMDREIQDMRRDYYGIESTLREMIRDVGIRVDRLETCMRGRDNPENPFAPVPEWR